MLSALTPVEFARQGDCLPPELAEARSALYDLLAVAQHALPGHQPERGWDNLQKILLTALRWRRIHDLDNDITLLRLLLSLTKRARPTRPEHKIEYLAPATFKALLHLIVNMGFGSLKTVYGLFGIPHHKKAALRGVIFLQSISVISSFLTSQIKQYLGLDGIGILKFVYQDTVVAVLKIFAYLGVIPQLFFVPHNKQHPPAESPGICHNDGSTTAPVLAPGNPSENCQIDPTYLWLYLDHSNTFQQMLKTINSVK